MTATGRAAAGALAVLALVSACSASPDASAAAEAASALVEAVASSDGAAACTLLAPAAVQALESEFSAACEEAVLEPEVADEIEDAAGGGSRGAQAFGRQAQVRLEGDTVFLTLSGETWLVTAAGCTPRTDQPYECAIEGG
ncbi:hypothetical protein ICW40_15930 [Actinotalea ferrariae]|uniref:hypothetical protein n=1 Tax=Actinotalea ferrariae TaxID=1386098 RepID=UPI001C8B6C62|nr:hypothetical protein [Actinotalea ferrariae]MBX9246288.1 hypothetical protein [Actinotalea ferrariae]